MIKKIRCFEITLQNGHGRWIELVPAHSKDNALVHFSNPDHKVVSVIHKGWLPVNMSCDGFSIIFCINGCEINNESPYYSYIYQQMLSEIDKFKMQMLQQGYDLPPYL
ncbi:TPA: hypothetical protein ACVU5S_003025 [Vibrio parahaemolyticus]|uniref:hypothetical protein n=1 Tax=Vibrio parahaemolyticus TaxID=670 RepID=UPI00081BFE89|nr:hypothetical protein [Vibrio parahaemolyticus]EJC1449755.1 hypothetical protein [Vibrio parahaemolyticus]EJE4210430.1 hypothetical protein [Vibrio parahaemolyticus]MDF4614012.1 hypothetical protein [Vibrio parahaemolyticus]HCZ9278136.1 hypothetical protein [Vibrio alginolyticus]